MRIVAAAGLAALFLCSVAEATTPCHRDFSVYCISNRIRVSQKSIEELKSSIGNEVCRVDQDTCERTAEEKAQRYGGLNASCRCD